MHAMFLGWLLVLSCLATVSGGNIEEFPPLCDLHANNYGPQTPVTMLPEPASPSWLFPSKGDIEKYYVVAKRQCENFISNEQLRRLDIRNDHAPLYPIPITGRGQLKCRGRDTLYDVTGKVVWPFGPGITNTMHSKVPHSTCTTYSKCWIGLLSCGKFDGSVVLKYSKDEIEKARVRVTGSNTTFPGGAMKWSMKSLDIQIRVVGPEIVVPDQRLVSLSVPSEQHEKEFVEDDVIIGQYALTLPHNNYTIEMRHFEFYPSALLPWKREDFSKYHVENFGMIYLGGSEGRCRPWTKCDLSNICCGCDERSFVVKSPIVLHVDNAGEDRCVNELNLKKPDILPLCKVGRDTSSKNPSGRWIQANIPASSRNKLCNDGNSYNIARFNVPKHLQHTKEHLDQLAKEDQADAHLHHGWYEASGNPCIKSDDKEELGSSNWFFAPYTCKYHFYERHEVHQCLRDLKIGHIHFQGDSMSRELFSLVSTYLGVSQVSEANLKHMTNNMQMKDIRFHTGAVLLSEGYSWDFNPPVLKLSEQPPLPNVIISNYALAHRTDHLYKFSENFENTEYKYWTVDRNQSLPKPQFLIFQGGRALHGRRTNSFNDNIIRQASNYAKERYGTLGFVELEEYPITAGRYDLNNKYTDGWHFMGTARQMEAIILFNIICNQWLEANSTVSR